MEASETMEVEELQAALAAGSMVEPMVEATQVEAVMRGVGQMVGMAAEGMALVVEAEMAAMVVDESEARTHRRHRPLVQLADS